MHELIMLIGVTGSGKSTYTKYRQALFPEKGYEVFNQDELRLKFFRERTGNEEPVSATLNDVAWKYCCSNEQRRHFNAYVKDVYHDLLNSGVNIIHDNTNLSRNSRHWWINQARIYNYDLHAVVLNPGEDALHQRRKNRTDKTTPPELSIPTNGCPLH